MYVYIYFSRAQSVLMSFYLYVYRFLLLTPNYFYYSTIWHIQLNIISIACLLLKANQVLLLYMHIILYLPVEHFTFEISFSICPCQESASRKKNRRRSNGCFLLSYMSMRPPTSLKQRIFKQKIMP